MVITIINGKSEIFQHENRLEEIRNFIDQTSQWQKLYNEAIAEKNPEISAAMHKTSETMVLRMMRYNTEFTVVVTIAPSADINQKQWHWEDKMIDNSQGGQTHIKGWFLE